MPTQKDVGDCCLCIPLRIGVGMLCVYTFLHGLICVLGLFIGDVRMQAGGYAPDTNQFQVRIGCLGIIFGVTGLLGVIDNKLDQIKYYNYFQYVKLVVSVIVFVADMRELAKCDTWGNNLQSQIAYNAPIDTIALKGLCSWTRYSYQIGFALDFTLQCYFTWVSAIYHQRMQSIPPYFLAFDSMKGGDDHGRMTFFDPDIGEVGQHLGKEHHPKKFSEKKMDKITKEQTENYGTVDDV